MNLAQAMHELRRLRDIVEQFGRDLEDLHDGLYALAHADDPPSQPTSAPVPNYAPRRVFKDHELDVRVESRLAEQIDSRRPLGDDPRP